MIYNCVIVDDEMLALDVIAEHLRSFSDFKLVGRFTQPVEALKFLSEQHVDLIFTDIAMPNISGLELIKIYNGEAKFIVTTSHSEYAIRSFDLDVVDFLLKPISDRRFARCLERFKVNVLESNSADEATFIKQGDDFIKLEVGDVLFIEGMGDYAKVHLEDRYYLVLKTLKSLLRILGHDRFMRVHKSYIVHLSKIDAYRRGNLRVQGREVPVGPSYRDKVKDYLNRKLL